MRTLLAAGAVILSLAPAFTQEPAPAPKPTAELADRCPGLVAQNTPDKPRVIPAGFFPGSFSPGEFSLAALGGDQARITYIGHSTFLIESPRLVRIATDYNDYVKPPVLPDIVTMNHAHSSHYTDRPDPAIKYVLRGWGPSPEEPARHDITYEDVRVRNVPTNIRDWGGGTERHGNSIFIFEMAQMCIAHLGHLHHTLTQQQLNEMGRVDIVLAPVDGSYTLDLDGMVEVLKSLKPQLVIPMHYFSAFTLDRFLSRMRQEWDVEIGETPSIVVSKTTLPAKPKVLALPGH
jgi:L-ascorbate metabolism protein UlaG (beta-lactamase superfamily)